MESGNLLIVTPACPAELQDWNGLRSLKNWSVEAHLGEGVHTSVALVSCANSTQLFALKMYHRDRLTPELTQQVRREIKLHASCRSSRVIPLYAAFEDDDGIYLLQQRAALGDLFSHIADSGGFLFEDEAKTIVWCLVNAVAALHQQLSRWLAQGLEPLTTSLLR
ncbi:hypothetical protein WJX84_002292 [Apatococcus fuscideae]|uniref:Protein kinase domain-containing protein n=1 Tax=Apatococcus fuscideae TaxID=2026836 RepID=A0AAW1RXD2_9CHLO